MDENELYDNNSLDENELYNNNNMDENKLHYYYKYNIKGKSKGKNKKVFRDIKIYT
jgi:hypothetical protein